MLCDQRPAKSNFLAIRAIHARRARAVRVPCLRFLPCVPRAHDCLTIGAQLRNAPARSAQRAVSSDR
eukprot:3633334-Lingulodinium_polyedra.AAC.1